MPMMTRAAVSLTVIAWLSGLALTALAWLGAGVALVGFFIAWSDFRYRDCQSIPRESWANTADCSDSWSVMMIGMVGGGLLALVAGLMTWFLLRYPRLNRNA